jgi:hypothetical protein
VTPQQLMRVTQRVYGALMWSLGKVRVEGETGFLYGGEGGGDWRYDGRDDWWEGTKSALSEGRNRWNDSQGGEVRECYILA